MFDWIHRLFGFREPTDDVVLELEPEEIDTDPEFLFGIDSDSPARVSPGPVLHGMNRSYEEYLHACHIRGCVRPSSFTVMTTQSLDVDIPFSSPDRLRTPFSKGAPRPLTPYDTGTLLPTYKQYFLCDRHYDSLVRGKPGTAYVIGPAHIYNPDTDDRTQRKLAV